jgi:hypothetical protein
VELTTGEVGVVVGQTKKADPDTGRFVAPRVFIMLDANNKDASDKGKVIDLSKMEGVKINSVINPST